MDKLETNKRPQSGNFQAQARRQSKNIVQVYPFQLDKAVKKDLW